MDSGELCVMMAGLQLTLVWLVVSLGFLLLVATTWTTSSSGGRGVCTLQDNWLPWATACSLRDSGHWSGVDKVKMIVIKE